MTLTEFADVIGRNIIIKYYANQNRYAVSFEHSDTLRYKGDCIITGPFGNGVSVQEAMQDYVDDIKGKILVLDALTNRREYNIPNTLTI